MPHKPGNYEHFVAKLNGVVVSYIRVFFNPNKSEAEIYSFFTNRKLKKEGIGRRLFGFVNGRILMGHPKVKLVTIYPLEGSHGFYDHTQYKGVGKTRGLAEKYVWIPKKSERVLSRQANRAKILKRHKAHRTQSLLPQNFSRRTKPRGH